MDVSGLVDSVVQREKGSDLRGRVVGGYQYQSQGDDRYLDGLPMLLVRLADNTVASWRADLVVVVSPRS